MKLIVTVGNANGDNEELVFNVPEPITWLGVEIEDNSPQADKTGRLTIMRQPFISHGMNAIHTICSRYDDSISEVEM